MFRAFRKEYFSLNDSACFDSELKKFVLVDPFRWNGGYGWV